MKSWRVLTAKNIELSHGAAGLRDDMKTLAQLGFPGRLIAVVVFAGRL
jgi:hypothetical protein